MSLVVVSATLIVPAPVDGVDASVALVSAAGVAGTHVQYCLNHVTNEAETGSRTALEGRQAG